jgi:hypothetical protein
VKHFVVVVVLAVLLAGCGQTSGVHVTLVQQFRNVVSVSPIAHGASARTRTTNFLPHAPQNLRPPPVPEGQRIVIVPAPSAAPGTPVTLTWPQWAALLLDRLSAPRCANNLIAVVAWADQENSNASWNPLDTTYDEPGATSYNSVGVRNYVSLEQGLDATVATLALGATTDGYGAIVADLRVCAAPVDTATAINASNWCRGCTGGEYVFSVLPSVIAAYLASLNKS